jgi:hypothetical protein
METSDLIKLCQCENWNLYFPDSEDSDISSLEREREKSDLYAKVNRKPTPHKKKPKQRCVERPIISMPFPSDEHGRHLGVLRKPDERGTSHICAY